jgi:hypothetical protein
LLVLLCAPRGTVVNNKIIYKETSDMKKQIISAVTSFSLIGFSAAVFAADVKSPHADSKFGFVGEFDAEFGGDEVASVLFTDNTTQGINAGQGLTLAVGMHFRPANWDVDFSGTAGYKFVTTAASNADIGITRTVLQLMATYDPSEAWWVGAGPVWHNNVKFNADGLGRNLDLGSATGFTVQAGWKWIGLTYTKMEYTEVTTGRGYKYDAGAIGLTLRWKS